jgi:2-hydroxychromene-2-carboxylate isomerase
LILIAAKKLELDLEMISSEFMQCHWLNNLDLNNADAMVEKLKSIDLDADTLMQLSKAPEVIAEYEANTNTAIEAICIWVTNLFRRWRYVLWTRQSLFG